MSKTRKAPTKKKKPVKKTVKKRAKLPAAGAPRKKSKVRPATVSKKAKRRAAVPEKSGRVRTPRTKAPAASRTSRSGAKNMLKKLGEIYHLKDLDSLLERILTEARRFTRADAGTIYLATRSRLHFNFVQNDTLFKSKSTAKRDFLKATLPLDKSSIAGYVAVTGKTVIVDDAYRPGKEVVCGFNREMDEREGYRTRSVLAVPIAARNNVILGVLQLINARDRQGRTVIFSPEDILYISQFANSAGYAVENARLSREMAFRMVGMAALRDPSETAAHAERVSLISSKLYLAWARKHHIDTKERRLTRETLRIAAILHDVGKVAVSDMVLKKPGKLTPDERYRVRCHTVYGARLFTNMSSPWDRAAAEVALNHHEQWNGGGYPGKIKDVRGRDIVFGPGKKGREIPLLARIVSIADVFDSLVSKRVYKKEWSAEAAYEFIQSKAGIVFDPELVALFLDMKTTVRTIEARYQKME